MKIKSFGKDHLTSYKFNMCGKNIMFDFDGDIRDIDIKDLDFLFISHEHLDHFGTLLEYDVVKNLNPNCKIYSTQTTKKIMKLIAVDRLTAQGANKKEKEFILSLIDNIIPLLFNEKISITDNISATLLRSGHTFGSAMVFVESSEFSILYTGDLDYVEGNYRRQYQFPNDERYMISPTYVIADGTCLSKMERSRYKNEKDSDVIDYINRKKQKVIEYSGRPEKIIFYFLHLATKTNENIIFLYPSSFAAYLDVLVSQGYYPFTDNRVIYLPDIETCEKVYSNCKKIITVGDVKDFTLDKKLSLHISAYELSEMFNNHFSNNPIILFGHYDNSVTYDDLIEFSDAKIIRKGVFDYD